MQRLTAIFGDWQAMQADDHDGAERCTVNILPGGVAADQKFMVDRLENKVRNIGSSSRHRSQKGLPWSRAAK